MAEGYLLAKDVISGKEGAVYANINGEIVFVAECKNIKAKIAKKKSEVRTLGQLATQYKTYGWDGSGSMTIHYVTSRWAKLAIDYANGNGDTYFKIQITNRDSTSQVGHQTVTLEKCNFDDAEIASIDVDADQLEQSLNFTFSGVKMDKEFDDLSKKSDYAFKTPKEF